MVVGYPVFYQLGTTCVGLSATSRAKINEGINLVDNLTRTAAVAAGFTFADVRVLRRAPAVQLRRRSGCTPSTSPTSASPTTRPRPARSGGYLPVFRAVAG